MNTDQDTPGVPLYSWEYKSTCVTVEKYPDISRHTSSCLGVVIKNPTGEIKVKSVLFILLLILPSLSYSTQNSYTDLIQQALDKQPPLCLGELQWPVSMAQGESAWVYARMAALMEAGLVTDKSKSATKQWSLTPLGEKEFKKKNDFCYGNMRVNKIEQRVYNNGGSVSIIFDYRIENLPKWAQTSVIRGGIYPT